MQHNLFFWPRGWKRIAKFLALLVEIFRGTSAFASVSGVIDLRVEIHTSEIDECLFFSFMISNNQKE